ncbi:MAG: VOC family protein [Bacteroidia bacterium]
MKIRLLEIEFGSKDLEKSKLFYNSILGLETSVEQDGLKVFNSGVNGIDFNTSTHFPPKTGVTSFLTNNLQDVIDRLTENNIIFNGPKNSHLGMKTIEFNDLDGYLIKVNQPTVESPSWLKV